MARKRMSAAARANIRAGAAKRAARRREMAMAVAEESPAATADPTGGNWTYQSNQPPDDVETLRERMAKDARQLIAQGNDILRLLGD